MIALLIYLLILVVVLYVLKLVLDALPLPDNIRQIALAIIGLIFLLVVLQRVFGFGAGWGL